MITKDNTVMELQLIFHRFFFSLQLVAAAIVLLKPSYELCFAKSLFYHRTWFLILVFLAHTNLNFI
jgi:hypothetical protein